MAALAGKNGVALPVADPVELYRFSSLAEFLRRLHDHLRQPPHRRRLPPDHLRGARGHVTAGIRYREMFFSPGFLLPYGVRLDTIWAGIRAGLADAHADLDIRCRMILDVDKGDDGDAAVELVEFAAAQDRDELIGVGGDNTERGIDHHVFAPAFALAGRHGLRRTMHCGEDGPVDNIRVAIEALGCERIDHGVALLDDDDLTARVVAERIPLTVCPISNVVLTGTVPSVAAHPFARSAPPECSSRSTPTIPGCRAPRSPTTTNRSPPRSPTTSPRWPSSPSTASRPAGRPTRRSGHSSSGSAPRSPPCGTAARRE